MTKLLSPEDLKKEKGLLSVESGTKLMSPYSTTPTINYGPYIKEMDDIYFNPYQKNTMSPEDILKERGRRQGTFTQTAFGLINIPVNLFFGLVEMAGVTAELPYYMYSAVTNQEYKKDFSNWLTEFANKGKNTFGLTEVYREDPNKVIDFDDWAWWVNNGSSLVSSMFEFGLAAVSLGAGYAGIAAKGARLLQSGLKMGARASKVTAKTADLGARLATTASLGYLEGAKSGAPVYQFTFDEVYSKTGDYQKAVEEASKAAATTVATNTALIGLLSATSLSPIFSRSGYINQARKYGLTPKKGEKFTDYLERLKNFQGSVPEEGFMSGKKLLAFEGAQESIEELANVYSEEVGFQAAGISEYDETGLDLFLKLAKTDEGKLSMALGALGGVGQTFVLNNARYKKVKDENGNIVRKSPNQLRKEALANMGVNYAQRMVKDIQYTMDILDDMKKATAEGKDSEAQLLKEKLFDIYAKRSITLDGGESVSTYLDYIASIDNTVLLEEQYQEEIDTLLEAKTEATPEQAEEIDKRIEELQNLIKEDSGKTMAMKMGLADSEADNKYKETARKKQQEIKELVELYKEIKDTYSYGDEGTAMLADHIFKLEMNERRSSENIKENKRRYDDLKNSIKKSVSEEDGIDQEEFELVSNQVDAQRKLESLQRQLEQKKKELENIQENLTALKEKYNQVDEDSLKAAIRTSIRSLNRKIKNAETSVKLATDEVNTFLVKNMMGVTDGKKKTKPLSVDEAKEKYEKLVDKVIEDEFFKERLEEFEDNINKEQEFVDTIKEAKKKIRTAKGREAFVKAVLEEEKKVSKKAQELNERSKDEENSNRIAENLSRSERRNNEYNLTGKELSDYDKTKKLTKKVRNKLANKYIYNMSMSPAEAKIFENHKDEIIEYAESIKTEEVVKEIADTIQYAKDVLKELSNNYKNNKKYVGVQKDGTIVPIEDGDFEFYGELDESGKLVKKFQRASSVVGEEIEESALVKISQEIGTNVDNLLRDYFQRRKEKDFNASEFISNYNVAEPAELKKFIKALESFAKELDKNGEEVFSEPFLLLSEAGFAGTTDIITLDKAGKLRIYDIKTIRNFSKPIQTYTADGKKGELVDKYDFKGYYDEEKNQYIVDETKLSLREKHQAQLSLYNIALENSYGIQATEMFVIPIETYYNKGDKKTSKLRLRAKIPVDKLSYVGGYALNYPTSKFTIPQLRARFFSKDVTESSDSEENMEDYYEEKKAVSSFKIQYGFVREYIEDTLGKKVSASNTRKDITIFESGLADFDSMDIVLEADVSFKGTVYDDDGKPYASTYADERKDGTDNVPIRIVDRKTGDLLGYLPAVRWISRKNKEGVHVNIGYGTEKNPINVKEEIRRLKELRKNVIDLQESGSTDKIKISITNQSRGSYILNYKTKDGTVDGEVVLEKGRPVKEARPVSEAILDPNVQIGIISNKRVVISIDKRGKSKKYAKSPLGTPIKVDKYNGTVVINLDGEYLNVRTGNIDEKIANTLYEALSAKVENNEDLIRAIKSANTEFNFQDSSGLREFFNQFVFLSSFKREDLKKNPNRTFIYIDVQNGYFYIGKKNTVITNDTSGIGKTKGGVSYVGLEGNRDKLKEFLKNARISVKGYKGLNTNKTFRETVIKDGKVSFIEHDNYNSFVKQYLTTTINGTNFVEYEEKGKTKRKYIYKEQPAVYFTVESTPSKTKKETKEGKKETELTEGASVKVNTPAALRDNLTGVIESIEGTNAKVRLSNGKLRPIALRNLEVIKKEEITGIEAEKADIERRIKERLEKPYVTFNDGSGTMVTVTTTTTEKKGIKKTKFKTQTTDRKGEPKTRYDKGYNTFEEAVENLGIDLQSEKNEGALDLIEVMKEARGKETFPVKVIEIRESTDKSSPFFGVRHATIFISGEKIDFKLKNDEELSDLEKTTKTKTEKKKTEEVITKSGDKIFDLSSLMASANKEFGLDESDETSFFPVREIENEELTDAQKEALDRYRIGSFSSEQQQAVTMSMVYAIYKYIESKNESNENANYKEAFNWARSLFVAQYEKEIEEGKNPDKAELKRQIAEDYWDKFKSKTERYLASIGYVKTKEEVIESEESNYEKRKFETGFTQNHKDTAAAIVKMRLSLIPKVFYDNNGEKKYETNFLGMPSFQTLDRVWSKVLRNILAANRNSESIKQSLMADGDPELETVVALINKDKHLENNFFTAFNLQRINKITVYTKAVLGGYITGQGRTDYTEEVAFTVGTFSENMLFSSPFVTEDEKGNYVINVKEVEKFKKEYIKSVGTEITVTPYEAMSAFSKLLNNIGIPLSRQDILDYLDTSERTPLGFNIEMEMRLENPRSFANTVFNTLLGVSLNNKGEIENAGEGDFYEYRSPVLSTQISNDLKALAKAIIKRDGHYYSGSYLDINNNQIYPWQKPSYLSNKIQQIKDDDHREELQEELITKHSEYLEYSDSINLFYTDGLKNSDTNYGNELHKLNLFDSVLFHSSLFFSRAAQTNFQLGMFAVPRSDKTTVPIIEAPIEQFSFDNDFYKKGKLNNLDAKALSRVMNYVMAEYERIIVASSHDKEGLISDTDPYKEGHKYFFKFPFLNYESLVAMEEQGKITSEELRLVYPAENTMSKDMYAVRPVLEKIVSREVAENVNQTFERFDKLGMLGISYEIDTAEGVEIQRTSSFIHKPYLNANNVKKTNEENLLNAIYNLVVNNIVFHSEYLSLISLDPAHYWKGSVSATLDSLYKRAAKDIAPRTPGNVKEEEKEITRIVSNDVLVSALVDGLPDSYYKNKIDIGDGSQVSTVKSRINTLKTLGKITPQEAQALRDKVKPGKYYEFTDEEVKKYFDPMKDLYTGEERDVQLKTRRPVYIKNATFVLLPQFFKRKDGTMAEMDKIRILLERNGVDLMTMKSAGKLGNINVLQLFDGKKVRDDITDQEIIEATQNLDRMYYGLQQEESKKDNKEIKLITQFDTLLFSGFRNTEGFLFKGKKFKGRNLEKIKDSILRQIYKRNKKIIYDELGVEIVDGAPIITNFSNLKDFLERTAAKNNWKDFSLDSLRLTPEQDGFIVPQEMTVKFNSIQAILMSIVSKIAETGFTGQAFVQAPSLLVTSSEEKSSIREIEEEAQEEKDEEVEEETKKEDEYETLMGRKIKKLELPNEDGIVSGKVTKLLRKRKLDTGVYSIGGKLYKITNIGFKDVDSVGGLQEIMKSQNISPEDNIATYLKEFFDGERKLYVLDIEPYDYLGDLGTKIKNVYSVSKQMAGIITSRVSKDSFIVTFDNGDVEQVSVEDLEVYQGQKSVIEEVEEEEEAVETEYDKFLKIAELNKGKKVKVYFDDYIESIEGFVTGRIAQIVSPSKVIYDDGTFEYMDDGVYALEIRTKTGKIISPDMMYIEGLEMPKEEVKPITVTYESRGKTQTYTVEGARILNKDGKEVYKKPSIDRNKIFANARVQEGKAVVVTYGSYKDKEGNKKNAKYVVNTNGQILFVRTGKIMNFGNKDKNRKNILRIARKEFDKSRQEISFFPVETEKGKLGIDKNQILKLLGASMYNKPFTDVAVKELLQNSFDAVKSKANKVGSSFNGKVDISINYDERTIELTDNGIGMSPDTVKNSFLTVGGTNKEGLSEEERSGGFGIAKIQFLLGSEKVSLVTVKDGVKTTVEATALQLYTDDFSVVTESTNEPSGTTVKLKVPENYVTPEGTTKKIRFPDPWSEHRAFDILTKPLLGNVEITFNKITNNKINSKVLSLGINTGDTIPGFFTKIEFSWGSADLYMSNEKQSWATHTILSSGLFQFETSFKDSKGDRIPYNIVLDIKPRVPAGADQYPFNNQREGFKRTVEEDITALRVYLDEYLQNENRKELVETFSNLLGVKKTDPNKILTPEERSKIFEDTKRTAENNKRLIKTRTEEQKKNRKIVISRTKILESFTSSEGVREEKSYPATFKAERESSPDAESSVNTSVLNSEDPQLHNNTNLDINNPEVFEFLTDFASVVHEMVRFSGKELGPRYESLSKNDFFAGVSIDKNYGGVHVRNILNAIFVNPLSFDVSSLEEAVGVALHIIIHEINHTTVSGEGARFTSELAILYGKIYNTGKYAYFEGLFRSVYKKHFKTFETLKNKYDERSTKNKAVSFTGNRITSSLGTIQGDTENVPTRQPIQRRDTGNQGDIEGVEGSTGEVILSNLNKITPQQKQQVQIQEQVSELFESNPELANQVYEALGFIKNEDFSKTGLIEVNGQKYRLSLKIFNQTLKIDFSLPNDYGASATTPILNLGLSQINNLFKSIKDRINPIIKDYNIMNIIIGESFVQGNKKAEQRKKLYLRELKKYFPNISLKTKVSEQKEYLGGDLYSLGATTLKITPQQKQQALKLYAEYLSTIFLESKLKGLYEHSGRIPKGEDFDKKFITGYSKKYAFYFTPFNSLTFIKTPLDILNHKLKVIYKRFGIEPIKTNVTEVKDILTEAIKNSNKDEKVKNASLKLLSKELENYKNDYSKRDIEPNMYLGSFMSSGNYASDSTWVLLNSKNPLDAENNPDIKIKTKKVFEEKGYGTKLLPEGYDGIFSSSEAAVPEPSQIHTLGSKKDIEGFKEFVDAKKETKPESETTIETDEEISFFPTPSKDKTVISASNKTRKKLLESRKDVLNLTKYKKENRISDIVTTKNFDPSKGLKFVTNESGEVTHAQVFVKWNFRDPVTGKVLDIDEFIGEDGTIDFDLLPPEVLRSVSSRIPNQAHSSMLPIEIVGFLPDSTDKMIVVPDGITMQMGSDFDIDKLYAYLSDYYYDHSTRTINKFDLDSNIDSYEDIYNELFSELHKRKNFSRYRELIYLFNKDKDPDKSIEDYLFREFYGEIPAKQMYVLAELLKDSMVEGQGIKLPAESIVFPKAQFLSEVKDQPIENLFKFIPTRMLKQLYVDIFESVLTHPEVFESMTKPLENNDIADEKEIIGRRTGKLKDSPDAPVFFTTVLDDSINKWSAAELVGISAIGLTMHSILEDKNIELVNDTSVGIKKYNIPIKVDGKVLKLSTLSGTGNSLYKGEKRTKQENLRSLLSTSVDNSNKNEAGYVNFNPYTAGVAIVLSTLEDGSMEKDNAVALDSVLRFISQDVINMYIDAYSKYGGITDSDFSTDKHKSSVKEVEDKILGLVSIIMNNPSEQTLDKFISDAKKEPIPDKDELKKLIRGLELDKDMDPLDYYKKQLSILYKFDMLTKISEELIPVRKALLNPFVNQLPTNVFDLMDLVKSFEKVLEGSDLLSNLPSLIGSVDESNQFVYNTKGAYVAEAIIEPAVSIISSTFPVFGYLMPKIEDFYVNILSDGDSSKLTNRKRKDLWFETVSYIWQNTEELGLGDANELRQFAFYEFPSMVQGAKLSKWGRNNLFVTRLYTQIAKNKNNPSRVLYQATRALEIDDQDIVTNIAAMLGSNNKEEVEFAKNLYKYGIMAGMRFNSESFMHLMPSVWFESEFTDIYSKIRKLASPENPDLVVANIVKQIARNKPYLIKSLSVDLTDKNKKRVKVFRDDAGAIQKITMPSPGSENAFRSLLQNGGKNKNNYVHMFKIKEEVTTKEGVEVNELIFEYDHTNANGDWVYHYVGRLGKSRVPEYHYNKKRPDSYFSSDSAFREDTEEKVIPVDSASLPKKPGRRSNSPYEKTKRMVSYYLPPNMTGKQKVENSLEKIKSNDYYATVAEIMSEVMKSSDRKFKIKFDNSLPSFSGYKQNTFYINLAMMTKRGFGQNDVERVLLHEYGHAITKDLIYRYNNEGLRNTLTKEQINLITALENVYKAVKKEVVGNNTEAFEKFNKILKKQKTSNLSLSSRELLWYYVHNFDEFAASIWFKDFQQFLNEIEYTETRNFKDRIFDILQKLFKSIAKHLNIEVKDNTALKEALRIVIELNAPVNMELTGEKSTETKKGKKKKSPVEVAVEENGNVILKNKKPTKKPTKRKQPTQTELFEGPKKGEPTSTDYSETGDPIDTISLYPANEYEEEDTGGIDISYAPVIASPAVEGAYYQTKEVISNIKASIGGTTNPQERERIRKLLDLYNDKLSMLVSTDAVTNAQEFVNYAQGQLEIAKKIISDPKSSHKELLIAMYIIDSWDGESVREFLPMVAQKDNNPWMNAISIISGRQLRVNTELINRFREMLVDSINETLNLPDKLTPEDLSEFTDIGKLYDTVDMSISGIPLAQYLNRILRNKQYRASVEFQRKIEDLENKIEELGFKGKDFEFMFQKDKDGNDTSRIVHEFTYEYDELMSEIYADLYNQLDLASERNSVEAKEIIRNAVKDFNKKINEINRFIDIRYFDENSELYSEQSEYKRELVKEYGIKKAEELIEAAEIRYASYKLHKQEFESSLLVEYENLTVDHIPDIQEGETKDEYIQRRIEEWELANSPQRAMYEKETRLTKSQYVNENGEEYLIRVPRKVIDGKDTGFYNESYEDLTEAQLEWLEYYASFMEGLRKFFPKSIQNSMPDNFYPKIISEEVKDIFKNGLGKHLDRKIAARITAGSVSFEEMTESASDADQRRFKRSKKIGYTKNLIKYIDTDNKIDPKNVSKNVELVMKKFAEMAIYYKHKNDIEAEALIINRIIESADEVDNDGNLIDKEKRNVNLKRQVLHMIKTGVYDDKTDESKPTSLMYMKGWNFLENNRNRKRLKEIKQEYLKLEDDLIKELISYDDYQQRVDTLELEYNSISGRPLVVTKIVQSFLDYNQLKHIGWNLRAGIANVGFGLLSAFTWAAASPEFNSKDLVKALGILLKGISNPKDLKVGHIIKKMNVLFEVRDASFGRGDAELKSRDSILPKKLRFVGKVVSPFWIQRKTEFFVQSLSAVAQMMQTKVDVTNKKTGEIENIPLFYALNETGDWNTDLYEEQEDWDYLNGDKMLKFRNQVIKTNYFMYGNYDPDNPPVIKRSVYMRTLFQFRNWVPYGVAQRYIPEYYDSDLGRVYKGRYRTFTNSGIGFTESVKGIAQLAFASSNPFAKKEETVEKLGKKMSAEDVRNLQMNLRELQILAGIVFFQILIGASLLDDDEEEEAYKMTGQFFMNQLFRIEQDILFYLNPATFEDVLRNPIPAFRIFIDFNILFWDTLDFLYDPSEYEKDHPSIKFSKTVPLLNQGVNFMYSATNSYRDK